MKKTFKSLLLFVVLAFGFSTIAEPSSTEKTQNKALEILSNVEFSGSIALVESEGEKDILIDEANLHLKIPISDRTAVLLQTDGRLAYGRDIASSDDRDGKFKKAVGLSVSFDVNPMGTPTMILVGEFNSVNFPLLSLSPMTEEEDRLSVERGATGASVQVNLPQAMSEEIGTEIRVSLLNRFEDRSEEDDYFEEDDAGYNLFVSHKFLNNKVHAGASMTAFDDKAGYEKNRSGFASWKINPKADVWTRVTKLDQKKGNIKGDVKDYSLGIGMNYKVDSQWSVFGRVDALVDKSDRQAIVNKKRTSDEDDNTRLAIGGMFSPNYLKNVLSVGVELYNRDYKHENASLDRENDKGLRSFLRIEF